MNASGRYFLGIDGGGSRCRARIRDASGNVLGEAQGGLANVYQDFDSAIATIRTVSAQVARSCGIALDSLYAGFGLAGVVDDASAKAVEAVEFPFAQLRVVSDGHAACLGAHGGKDGGIVIAGTGSAAFAVVGEKTHALGAMGFELGDDGSGAAIGRFVLRRAVLSLDDLVERTAYLDAILKGFGRDRGKLLAWSQKALSRDYASFAPDAFVAARGGDVHAREAVAEAAQGVALLATGLMRRGAVRLCLVGSVAASLRPWLPADVMRHVTEPLADPIDGAIVIARRLAGLEDWPT